MMELTQHHGAGVFRRWLKSVAAMLLRDTWMLLAFAVLHFFILYPLREKPALFGAEGLFPLSLFQLSLFYLFVILLAYVLPWGVRCWRDLREMDTLQGRLLIERRRRGLLHPSLLSGMVALLSIVV